MGTGEAEYINDIRAELDELFGVFIVSDVANATIKSIDASQALVSKFFEKVKQDVSNFFIIDFSF